MAEPIEKQIAQFCQWRDGLISAIHSYQEWLDRSGQFDAQSSLRIFDLLEGLKKEKLVLAFVAEFSRGKTELINALFFSDFKRRFLPSDVGRTTMCPTEIFHDPNEPPYLRLLPIETRFRDESISAFKRMPVEWSKISLDAASPERMIEALQSLTETKLVYTVEAKRMGLWDENDPSMKDMLRDRNQVEIPAWRFAQINYPHPLLSAGLVVLDTPGLNALGTEPELTVSAIPNAHGVLFLLAADTGVTRSDQEIWTRFVAPYVHHRIAILNKIDVLWDDLKTREEILAAIDRQLGATAAQLELPPSNVLALSAQKALLAKIRQDDVLLERSGIAKLENLLATDVIPTKRDIVRQGVLREIGAMVQSSRQSVHNQLSAARHELDELSSLSGKNQDVIRRLREKILADKQRYDESVKNFNLTRNVLAQHGRALLDGVSADRLNQIVDRSREAIEDSWTTAGLTRGMQALVRQVTRQFDKTHALSLKIKGLVDAAYVTFHEKHRFDKLSPPVLNLDLHRQRLGDLVRQTEDFCRDPVNIMTEKRFLIKKFFLALVGQAEMVFELARMDTETWLRGAMDPLLVQIKEYKSQLERRLENVKKIHDNITILKDRIAELHGQTARLEEQAALLDGIHRKLQAVPDTVPRLVA